MQAVRTAPLDHPDVMHGDVATMRAAQQAVPLPEGRSALAAPEGGGGGGMPAGLPSLSEMRGPGLPSFILDMQSMRPGEPLTAGQDVGPGQGTEVLRTPLAAEDPYEQLLEYFVRNYHDEESSKMLFELRGGQQGTAPILSPDAGALLGPGAGVSGPPPGELGGEGEFESAPLGADVGAGGPADTGDLDDIEELGPPVEGDAAPPSTQGVTDEAAAEVAATEAATAEAPVEQ